MEYHTYVFEVSKRKFRENFIVTFVGISLIAVLYFLVIIGLPGVGLITVSLIAFSMVKAKLDDDKEMGIKKYGNRKQTLSLGLHSMELKGVNIPYAELTDLVIYVDEYTGMPRQLFGSHHGGNNEITFIHNSNKYTFNYLIRNRKEYKDVERLVELIERSYPPKS